MRNEFRSRAYRADNFDPRHFSFPRTSGIPHGAFKDSSKFRDVARALYYGVATLCLIALIVWASNGSLA